MNPQAVELPLRDIHSAGTPPWWPPAPGWWALAVLAALAAGWLGWRAWRHYQRYRWRRALRGELAGIVSHWQARRDDRAFLIALSGFLRRLIVHVGGHRELAGITGTAWAEFLAGPDDDAGLAAAVAMLVEGPYRPGGPIERPERLVPLAERWIRRVTEPGGA